MPDIWDLSAIAIKFILYLGVFVSTGTVFAALLFQVKNIRRLTVIFASLGLIATVMGFSLGGAALTGDVRGMIDPQMLGLLWSTPVGSALASRLAGLILIISGMMFGRSGIWASAIGAALTLWSFTIVGHVSSRARVWLDLLLLIHLFSIALWIGILIPLQRLARTSATQDAAHLAHRFGNLAVIFVPLLVLAGLIMSYVLVGSIAALFGTGYGQALIVKVFVVTTLVGLGALNKLRFVPKLMTDDTQAAQHLSRSISFEWGAVILILVTTAVLTSALTLPS